MDERLLDIEDLPKPSVRPFAVPRDIFDARFEITDVFGPSHPIWDDDKSDEPEITKANEKNIAMPQGDRESVLNRTGTTVHTVEPFETGGSERNEVVLEKGPSTTVSSGFDFATSMDSQRSASAWNGLPSQAQNNEMSCFAGNADTVENMNSNGFGCSNEAIARLGRPRGKGGNRSNEQRRKRRSRAKYEAADEYPKFCSSPRERLNNNFGEDVKTSSPKNQTMNGGRSNGFGAGGGQRGRQEIPSNRPLAPICDNCGDDGHTAPVCPLPRRQDPNGFKCYNCNRLGFHIARDCNVTPSNQSSNREGLRCYNCNSYGHMAIRCSRPPMKNPRIGNNRGPSTRSARRRRTQTENGRKEAKAAQNKPASDFKGLDVICRLMKDKHLREETAKTTPKLYDEMLSLMIDHVSLNLLPSSGKK